MYGGDFLAWERITDFKDLTHLVAFCASIPYVEVVVSRTYYCPIWPNPVQLLNGTYRKPGAQIDNGAWFLPLLKSGLYARHTPKEAAYVLSVAAVQDTLERRTGILQAVAHGQTLSQFGKDAMIHTPTPDWFDVYQEEITTIFSIVTPHANNSPLSTKRRIGIAWDEPSHSWKMLAAIKDSEMDIVDRYVPLKRPFHYLVFGEDTDTLARQGSHLPDYDSHIRQLQARCSRQYYCSVQDLDGLRMQADIILGTTTGNIGYFQCTPASTLQPSGRRPT